MYILHIILAPLATRRSVSYSHCNPYSDGNQLSHGTHPAISTNRRHAPFGRLRQDIILCTGMTCNRGQLPCSESSSKRCNQWVPEC
ncbi:hypothetical protein F5141DRAFT_1111518 [Pisolithus sp. B1]|nr:hypothetical protein F5141DRAFT_1111518 [Pisolithus sp. B1]